MLWSIRLWDNVSSRWSCGAKQYSHDSHDLSMCSRRTDSHTYLPSGTNYSAVRMMYPFPQVVNCSRFRYYRQHPYGFVEKVSFVGFGGEGAGPRL